MAKLSRIRLFPIKSVAGISVTEVRILSGGALEHDREFALFSADGVRLRAKEHPRFHGIEPAFDLSSSTVTLAAPDAPRTAFHLLNDRVAIEQWFSDYLGTPASLRQDTVTGFPDDTDSPGPTIIGTASLKEVCNWFPQVNTNEAARRFRANLEIEGAPAFWEDQLFGGPDQIVRFRIGDVVFHGVNPCARCPVPSRHPESGEPIAGFQRSFSEKRQETLPAWVATARFNHYYRLSVNTRIPPSEAGKTLRVGDSVDVLR